MAYAVDALGDAVDATKELLVPFSRGRWLRFAVVAIFVGGLGGPPVTGVPSAGGDVQTTGPGAPTDVPAVTAPDFGLVLAVVGVVLAFALAWSLIGAVMEFVLVVAVRDESISLRRQAGDQFGHGLRLFAFRLVAGLLGLVPVVAVAWTLLSNGVTAEGLLAAAVVLIPMFVILGVLGWIVDEFTTAFVVPVMVHEERGVIDGWRRFWPVLTDEPGEFAVYAVLKLVLTVAAGFAVSSIAGIALFVIAIPFVVLGLLGFVAVLAGVPVVGILWIAVVALLFVAVALVVYGLVMAPALVYLRYFSLFVLGDVRESLDLITERRTAVREDTEDVAG